MRTNHEDTYNDEVTYEKSAILSLRQIYDENECVFCILSLSSIDILSRFGWRNLHSYKKLKSVCVFTKYNDQWL